MTESYLSSDIDEICQRIAKPANQLSGKTVLMTGGRGFLGRYFVEVFERLNADYLEEPCRILVYDNLITAGKTGSEPVKITHGEFRMHDVVEPFDPQEKIDFILHMAGIASPFYYRAYPLETLQVATTGTTNMLNMAHEQDARIVFFSSSEIYGDPNQDHVPTPESYRGNVACIGPRACYDESKRVGETLCHIFHTTRGTHTNTIRPFNVFGPGMQEADYRVMPNFASNIKGKRPLNVYGSGNQTRTFCYITDAMVGFLLVMLKGVPGEPYNIGNSKPEISMLTLVKTMEEALGRKVDHHVIEYPDSYPADEPNRRCPDLRKANLQLGYAPQVSLEDGVKRFLEWSDQHYTGEQ